MKAKGEMDALVLFKGDVGAYVRLYRFLSQIFHYGNTGIEKRVIFFKHLHPLLTFGREREGVDLSALRLTAFTVIDMGSQKLDLGVGEPVPIYATTEAGSGQVKVKQKVLLQQLIARVNGEGRLSPGDKGVARPGQRDVERHHGCAGDARGDAQAGAQFIEAARRDAGRVAGTWAVV